MENAFIDWMMEKKYGKNWRKRQEQEALAKQRAQQQMQQNALAQNNQDRLMQPRETQDAILRRQAMLRQLGGG